MLKQGLSMLKHGLNKLKPPHKQEVSESFKNLKFNTNSFNYLILFHLETIIKD
jgi:hypothetical protein